MRANEQRTACLLEGVAVLRTFRTVLAASTMALLCSGPLAAQTNTGNVYGSVVDELGAPIRGGHGHIDRSGGAAHGERGCGRLLPVPESRARKIHAHRDDAGLCDSDARERARPGRSEHTGRRSTEGRDRAGERHGHDAPPLIDSRKVETGQTFTGEELTQIPTARDVWSLIQQVPGVQLDTVNVAGNASANVGGPSLTNKGSGNVVYQIEGATITDNGYGNALARQNGGTSMYFDFSTLENVEVATGGVDPRAADLGRDDQRRHQARYQPAQGIRPIPLRLRRLAVDQYAPGICAIRGCRRTARGTSASTAESSAVRS